MNSRRIPLILIAVGFFVAVLLSCYFVFSISKVKVEYQVSEDIDTIKMQEELDSLRGKNLLFFEQEQVHEVLSNYPNCKVEYIKENLPNLLEIKVVERRPIYKFTHNQIVYLLDEEGVVVREGQGNVNDRDLIELKLEGINVLEPITLGKKIKTDNDNYVANAVGMVAESVNLADRIKSMAIKYLDAGETRDVVFSTYTGVDVVITKADISGIDKVNTAFESYDKCTIDFIKSFNQILVVMLDSGKPKDIWTRN